ncbi:ChaB family protein [Rickettsiales endosymbiont of Stachyamoeba lipophora]|uniref:ChaB family protein n=1 Tax=Rickettsiales endosymbiont of Stachyamoeba lipophora TaxID=2486578 RepID=UPI000F64BAEE|nr:ChaB family protein [Rickettsiales endosymbiont of Stachyamoeba lipophora]AZL16269.1 cation transport regulator ChaB [Rickettsiales endosymbiont of Stachyamoeba lipophora]
MPYSTIADLPDNIKNNLPQHAQEIYLKSFNNAWEEYKDPSKRKTDESREEIAHKVAWSAVKKKYHKVGDHWEEK